MSNFQRRHYELIAMQLAQCDADDSVIEALIKMFKWDNSRFSPQRFKDAIKNYKTRTPVI